MEKDAIVAALGATELELRIKNYSLATRKTYLTCLDAFLQTCSDIKHPSENHIKSFILKKQDKGLSSSTTNVYLQWNRCAICTSITRTQQHTDNADLYTRHKSGIKKH